MTLNWTEQQNILEVLYLEWGSSLYGLTGQGMTGWRAALPKKIFEQLNMSQQCALKGQEYPELY